MSENRELHLSDCWAKTWPDGPLAGAQALSVRDHCLQVGAVAEALWPLLPSAVRQCLPSSAVLLTAMHDIGKLTAGFQCKCGDWRARWLTDNADKSRAAGSEGRHAVISQRDLGTRGGEAADPKMLKRWAVALGGAGLGDCASRVTDKTVIGLFALHPLDKERGGDFGGSCRALSKRGADDGDPFEKHFRRLLACRTGADAAGHVARITRRLKNEGVAVNYFRLLWDLRSWSDRVRENWVRSYFATAEPGHERESGLESAAETAATATDTPAS